jgi:hypothetical protein
MTPLLRFRWIGGSTKTGGWLTSWTFALAASLMALTGQAQKVAPFEGDLFAEMPNQKPASSSFEEDQKRSQQASHWIRVVFAKESHPMFAELLEKRLKEKWNSSLGYNLVFGESHGPREEEATAATIRATITTVTSNMQYEKRPETERFIWAAELIARKDKYDIATTWDNLHFSAEKRLPQQFALPPEKVEEFNRAQMSQLYADFKKQLDSIPEFGFFPGPDFDLIRPMFTYRPADSAPPLSSEAFSQEVARLFEKQNANYRSYLGRIAIELVRHGATNYSDGICTIFADWNQQIHKQKIEVLRFNLGFANYQLVRCLAVKPQAQILLREIPEMKTDPMLAALGVSNQRPSPGASRATYTPAPAKEVDPLKLQAIFFSTRPSAIIGGRTVFIGDKVADFKVTKIDQQTVTLLTSGGETKVLRLSQ